MKRFLTLFLGLFFLSSVHSQSINLVYFNKAHTYFPGGSISLHIKPAGIFPVGTRFALQLLNQNGTVVVNDSMGVAPDFFTPVLNGNLPSSLAPGTYTLRAVAYFNGVAISSSAVSSSFTVAAAPVFTPPYIDNPSVILKVNCYTAPSNFFGYIDRGINDLTSAFTFDIPGSGAYTYTAKLINPQSGAITSLPVNTAFGLTQLSLPAGLPTNYYTIEITKTLGAFTSTYSYIYLFNTGNTSLGNTSSENVCVNDSVYFSVDQSVIAKNYPLSYYTLNYGDGSPVKTYTHAQFVLNPLVHQFTQPTCRDPNAAGGQYKVELYLFNKGLKIGTANNCDGYNKNGNGTTKFVNTSLAPIAQFHPPHYACLNKPLTIPNESIAGAYGNSTTCLTQYDVHWYLQSPSAASFSGVSPAWHNNPNNDLNIPANILNEPGIWKIKITAQNPEGCITISEDTSSFCVEPAAMPAFKMNNSDSLSGCAPYPISISNQTNANLCRTMNMKWAVLDSLSNPANASNYTITNDTARTPGIKILTPGKYFVQLTVSNSCGDTVLKKPANILGTTNVDLPPTKRYCDLRTIDFGTDPNHIPGYSQPGVAGDVYNWQVTSSHAGSSYSFINGTSAADRYPQIKFGSYDTYLVKLIYTNACGSKTTTQTISFDQPISVDAGPSSQTICFTQNTLSLSGSLTGSADSIRWTAYAPASPAGTGTFSNSTSLNNIYTFSASDKLRGEVWLLLKAYKPQLSACSDVSDTLKVTIQPQVIANSSSKNICSNTAVNYNPTGTPATGTTYTWTSVITSGTATGNGNGSGVINDVLLNNSASHAIVTYKIVPTYMGCVGDTGILQVTVYPKVGLAVPDNQVYCPGVATPLLSFSSSYTGVTYTWTNSDASIGLPSSGSGAIAPFTTVNNTLSPKVATIQVNPFYNGCPGNAKTFSITVNPNPVTPADAGPDQTLCAASTVTMNAVPPVGASGLWSQAGTPTTTIVTPSQPNTKINGLTPNTTYTFVWKVTGSSACSSTTDTVVITNRPKPTTAVTGADTVICNYNGLPLSLPVHANAPAYTFETGTWAILSNNTGSTPAISSNHSSNTSLTGVALAAGLNSGTIQLTWSINNDAGCAPSVDTLTIQVNRKPFAGAINGGATTYCQNSTVALTLNNYVGTILKWRIKRAPLTTGVYKDTAITSASFNLLDVQDSVLVQAIVGSIGAACNLQDTATLLIPVNAASMGGTTSKDSVYCTGNGTGTVVLSGYRGQIYWQQSIDDGATWAILNGATSSTLNYTNLLKTTWYRAVVKNGACPADTSSITKIKIEAAITNNTISQDQTICTNTIAPLLTGSQPSGGNGVFLYQWEKSTDGGASWVAITGATDINYSPGVLTQTTGYRRKVSTTRCAGVFGSTSNAILITVRPDAVALFTPTDTASCPVFTITSAIVNLQQDASRNARYEWYANGAFIGSGTTFPGYTLANDADTVIIQLKTISLYGCKNDSLSHTFITYNKPVPSFGMSDTAGCGPLHVTITNTTPKPNLFSYYWNFGNGQTSTAQNPGTVVFQPNPNYTDTIYTIRLAVISKCDTLSTTKQVLVKARPKALFTPDKVVGCSPFQVLFTNTSLGLLNNYIWDFGDGIIVRTNSKDTVSHTYHTGVRDTFYVKLKAVNECGSDSIQYAVIVSPNPIRLNFALNGNEQNGCLPHQVHFYNNTQGATRFFWNFGDGFHISTTKNIDTVAHTFTTPGTFIVQLRATNGCADTTATKTITVFPKPTANFTLNHSLLCLGDTLRVANNTTGATDYLWQFGDGATSALNSPTHAYTTPGSYSVLLKAFNVNIAGNVCSDTISRQVQVVASLPGAFTALSSGNGCAPKTITFTNQTVPSVSASWDFGDGTLDSGDIVTHTFTHTGTFVVKLTALVPGGCTYLASQTIVVAGPDGQLMYNGGYLCSNQNARLEATATNTDSLTWNFGDGTSVTTTQRVVFHHYQNPGLYLPSVSLNSNAGCRFTIQGTDTIKVDRIQGGFIPAQQHNCGSTVVSFTDTSHVFFGKASVKWNFGDGNFGSGTNVAHTYASSGVYTIQMIVTGKSGCADTTILPLNIVVNNKPVVTANAPQTGCTQQAITFNASIQSTDPVSVIQWSTSNGITSNSNPFKPIFTLPGTYTIKLIVGTVNGCFDTTNYSININPSPTLVVSNDLTLCRGNSGVLHVSGADTYNWTPVQGLSCTTCSTPTASPLVTTNYVVSGTNSFGCTTNDTVVVTVMQPFSLSASANKDSICVGQSINLLANGAPSYEWTGPNLSNHFISNPVATPAVTTTYKVVGRDAFNCFTDTKFITVAVGKYPTVNLGPDLTLAAGTVQPMVSVVTNGPIRNWMWTPATDLSCSNCPIPVATIKKDITYIVKVTTAYGCSASDTVSIKTFCEKAQAFIPNAFTPDGDGINDILMVRASGIVQVKTFRIFNRWGEVVFERDNFPPNNPSYGWDGKVKGIVGPPDVYVYTAEVVCENGTTFTYKGNVSVLK